jgi:hypothetical protein
MGQRWRSKFRQAPPISWLELSNRYMDVFAKLQDKLDTLLIPDRSIQELNPPCDPKVGAGRHRG